MDGLTDDILAAILIRLPAIADFGRAAAAFRRVIADPAFLRRVRALHPSLLLGFLTFTGGFRPVEPPYASVPAARAVARAADFSYSFLPGPSGWVVREARDGRVLLDRNDGGDGIFTKLAVCDPLFRRYMALPPIPEDLAAAVQQPHLLDLERKFEVFLVPSDQEEAAVAQTSFRVVWMAQCLTIHLLICHWAVACCCVPHLERSRPCQVPCDHDTPSPVLPQLRLRLFLLDDDVYHAQFSCARNG